MKNNKHKNITDWVKTHKVKTPLVVFDLGLIRKKYLEFEKAFSGFENFYAVKVNPQEKVLQLLTSMNSSFDIASIVELDLALAQGISPKRISYGNVVKKEADISYAWQRGVRLFAYDSFEELEKIANNAPNSDVYLRISVNNLGAKIPLFEKFGVTADNAFELIEQAVKLDLNPIGLSFHVGSQQVNVDAWEQAIASLGPIYKKARNANINLYMLNIGGGFPAQYNEEVPSLELIASTVNNAIDKYIGEGVITRLLTEPGRIITADSAILISEVILIKKDKDVNRPSWLFLDVGLYSGLIDAQSEAIVYEFDTDYSVDIPQKEFMIAGPTCDSYDVLYKENKISLPISLKAGDYVYIKNAGAYTISSGSCFNGMPACDSVCLESQTELPLFEKKILSISEVKKKQRVLW